MNLHKMVRIRLAICLAQCLAFGSFAQLLADHPQPDSGPFATPLTNANIDGAAVAEWFDGAEHPLSNPFQLSRLVWTQTTPIGWGFLTFGVSPQPGPRHLRLGFKSPLRIGSILMRAGDQVSVLRPNAPYPGNMADESQWMPASLMVNGKIVTAGQDAPVMSLFQFALWILPTGTTTRAIRFTHIADRMDADFSQYLGGVYLFSGRFANLAPQAGVAVSANEAYAHKLVDSISNESATWDNGPNFAHPVTAASPEWIILSWPKPVPLSGLLALSAGFEGADTEVLDAPANVNPQAAPESDWHPIGSPRTMQNQFKRNLGVDFFDFGKTVTTRAVRLRMTKAVDESRVTLPKDITRSGHRIWLGELMALSPLEAANLQTVLVAAPDPKLPDPPIPVHFNLDAPGYVTLVIDDAKGNRVRNLIADTWFDKGPNTVWWDGSDDLSRNLDAAAHGVYLIPKHFVEPGQYTVHGLTHSAVDLRYEMTVYDSGNPPWNTQDTRGGWLTNHTPPSSTLYVPGDKAPGGKPLVYLGSYVSEGGAGLAWVDLKGNKQGGRGWIGGNWTAAPYLARDAGTQSDPNVYAYVASVWTNGTVRTDSQAVVRLTGLTAKADKNIANYVYDAGSHLRFENGNPMWMEHIAGLAVHNGLAFISLPLENQLLIVDVIAQKAIGATPVKDPRGLAFDSQGGLLVLSGRQLLRYALPEDRNSLRLDNFPKPQVLVVQGPVVQGPVAPGSVAQGLQDPAGITCDAGNNIYVSDRGDSSQVKVFSPAGKFLRAIGHAAPPKPGPYDPLHMNNPRGLSIDSNQHLWVAEEDYQPKRVSEWSLDGNLIKAFYGPSQYGGGGSLDPTDKTKFYYYGMEFKLDWATGASSIDAVLYRPHPDVFPVPPTVDPSSVLYSNGHRYFINSYLSHGTNGVSIGMLYLDKGGILQPVAAMGKANDWPLFHTDAYKALLPPGVNLKNQWGPKDITIFTWSDINENGRVDPEEVTFVQTVTGWITIMPDTTAPGHPAAGPVMINANVDGKAMLYAPVKMTPSGIPVYDLHEGTVLVHGTQQQASDGGGQIIESPEETVLTTAPLPYPPQGLGGVDKQNHRWSYPSLWPGLHPSHGAPLAEHPGELLGTTHLLGAFVHPQGSNVGPLWAINSNFGGIYLFTADGLFVTQLFPDGRTGKPWSMPGAPRNMLMNDLSDGAENFYPSITQTSDGNIYLDDGVHTSIVRVDGLSSVRKLPATTLAVSNADLKKAGDFFKQHEATRQDFAGAKSMNVLMHPGPDLALDQVVDMLNNSSWATVDSRTVPLGFGSRQDVAEATVAVVGDKLVAAYRTGDPKLLVNTGTVTNGPFKTGGALDLMIGSNPSADLKRQAPVAGDLRLLVYQVQGKTMAMLFRAIVPGTTSPVPFSSPVKTITLDQVQDVSSQVQLISKDGNYAFSISLATLGLKPVAGQKIKADIGVLRGNGIETVQRVYWNNKATSITSDVPSEAELTPSLWGEWVFRSAP